MGATFTRIDAGAVRIVVLVFADHRARVSPAGSRVRECGTEFTRGTGRRRWREEAVVNRHCIFFGAEVSGVEPNSLETERRS